MKNEVAGIPELTQHLIAAFEAKDMSAILACFANDAVMIDPHYPQSKMVGKAAIEQGVSWVLGSMVKPSFRVKHSWVDGESGVIEVDTHHVFKGGMVLDFPQVFVVETRNGLITRLQSYPPHGPSGIGGLLITITRLVWRLQGKLK